MTLAALLTLPTVPATTPSLDNAPPGTEGTDGDGIDIPHEKLRGAALADATLNAQKRPLAQPVVGYIQYSRCVDALLESEVSRKLSVLSKTLPGMKSDAAGGLS
jgi:hypothetical protein